MSEPEIYLFVCRLAFSLSTRPMSASCTSFAPNRPIYDTANGRVYLSTVVAIDVCQTWSKSKLHAVVIDCLAK
jgi:hypothetical protein